VVVGFWIDRDRHGWRYVIDSSEKQSGWRPTYEWAKVAGRKRLRAARSDDPSTDSIVIDLRDDPSRPMGSVADATTERYSGSAWQERSVKSQVHELNALRLDGLIDGEEFNRRKAEIFRPRPRIPR